MTLRKLLGLPPSNKTDDLHTYPIYVEPPYRLRDDFLSPAEHSFYLVLHHMVAGHLAICPKVSLGDIFFVVRPHENRGAWNKIDRKHVDFLLCEPKTMKPVCGVELDDNSHTRPDRVERDLFVEDVFYAADLPLIRVPLRHSYDTTELGALFSEALKGRRSTDAAPQPAKSAGSPPVSADPPFCPKCGEKMMLRTARKGVQAGKQFYGCPNYPHCRQVSPAPG
jgi:hypothetical protein